MNLIKKVTVISALCTGLGASFSNLYASEMMSSYEAMKQYGFSSEMMVRASTAGSLDFVAEMSLYQETRNGNVYIIMSVNDSSMQATINGSQEGIFRDDLYHFAYKVPKQGWYEVSVWGRNGRKKTESIYVKLADNTTTIDLSKEYKDNECYLAIKAKDNDGIKSVTVNDVAIAYNTTDEKTLYRVYNSGTYTVIVTDKNDNREKKTIDINVSGDGPTLTLSKKSESGKWYVVIKVDSKDSISKVTVNDEKITFPSAGGSVDYNVTKSGTYKVAVTDKSGSTKIESINVSMKEQEKKAPVVDVSQNYKTNNTPGWYLIIKVEDDNNIASITVNGSSVNYDQNKGYALYYVPTDGNYTVVVTDKDGQSTSYTTFAAGNTPADTNVENNTGSTGNTTIVFKLNSKAWTKNGVAQEQMDVAPKTIHSRVYLPVRYIAYALGIDSGNISWDSKTKTVTIHDGSSTMTLKVGSKTMNVDGKMITMSAAPTEMGGRVLLPLSQISAAFANRQIQLDWNNNSKQLTISRK